MSRRPLDTGSGSANTRRRAGSPPVGTRRSDLQRRRCTMFKLWERWGTELGIAAVAGWVIAFAIASGAPGSEDSDAKITSWYASSSHQTGQIVGFFVFLAGTLCVIGFYAAARERLADAGHAEMGSLAFGAGI